MATSSPADALDAYYNAQTQRVNDAYAANLGAISDNQNASDLSYAQKIAALQDSLQAKNDALPNSYAARGLLNSGIYNYGGGGGSPEYTDAGFRSYQGLPGSQLGAAQENIYQGQTALSDLGAQRNAADNAFTRQAAQAATTQGVDNNAIGATEALDQSRQAISDAISGVGL